MSQWTTFLTRCGCCCGAFAKGLMEVVFLWGNGGPHAATGFTFWGKCKKNSAKPLELLSSAGPICARCKASEHCSVGLYYVTDTNGAKSAALSAVASCGKI